MTRDPFSPEVDVGVDLPAVRRASAMLHGAADAAVLPGAGVGDVGDAQPVATAITVALADTVRLLAAELALIGDAVDLATRDLVVGDVEAALQFVDTGEPG